MKKSSKELKHPNSSSKKGTIENEFKKSSKENKSGPKDQPPLKIIGDEFEFDSTPFSAFEDLTGSVKNQG